MKLNQIIHGVEIKPGSLIKVVQSVIAHEVGVEGDVAVRLPANSIVLTLTCPELSSNSVYPWSVRILGNSKVLVLYFCDNDFCLRLISHDNMRNNDDDDEMKRKKKVTFNA